MGGSNPVTKLVKSVVKFVSKVVNTVVNFIGDIVGFVFNPMGSFDVPTAQTQNPEQEAQGVTLTKNGTNIAIPVVYGFRRVGGALVFMETNGTSNKYLYAVYVVSEGEIQGFKRILVEDVELPLPTDVYPDGVIQTVRSGRFKDRIKFQCFNGTEIQAQSNLANEAPNFATKQRRYPGVAYCVVRYEWKEIKTQEDQDNNPFSGGIPKIQFDILGKKVFDVRTHTTGKNLANDYDNLSKGYSFNPANCLLDYLMNNRYGCGFSKEEIDAEAFKIAANKYEQTVTYFVGQAGRAMTLNGVIDTNNKLFDNVKNLVGACRGIMPYVQGRYKLKVEDGGNATDISSTTIDVAFDVTSRHVIGGITLDGERKNAKYNEVIVNYVDPDQNFTNQQVVYSVDGDKATDDNELLKREFTFPMLTNKALARDLAILIYKKSRTQRSISFTATQELLAVEVGDIIRVTDTILGLDEDTFRVVDLKLNVDLTVDITAVEHDATIYPFTSGEQVEIPPPLFLPDELSVRPRQRIIPSVPLGILPPNDPDFDSAGAVEETNPLPPEIIEPLSEMRDVFGDGQDPDTVLGTEFGKVRATTIVTTDQQTVYEVDALNYPIPLRAKFTPNSSLAVMSPEFYPATHLTYDHIVGDTDGDGTLDTQAVPTQFSIKGGEFIFRRFTTPSSLEGNGNFSVVMLLNEPTFNGYEGITITHYDRTGTELSEERLTRSNTRFNFVFTNVGNNAGGVRFGAKSDFVKVRARQRLQGTEFEIPYNDDLGSDFTYFDALDQTTKTGRHLEAFLNTLVQDPSANIFGLTVDVRYRKATRKPIFFNLGA